MSKHWLRTLIVLWAVAMTGVAEARTRVTVTPMKSNEKSLDQQLAEKIRCARDLIYTEARGESEYGQSLVVWTVLRRMQEKRREWAGSFCDNVYRYRYVGKRLITQYAGPIHKPVTKQDDDPELLRLAQVAIRVLFGHVAVRPEHRCAVAYQRPEHADPRSQDWFSTLASVGRVGNHTFYCLPQKMAGK